MQGFKNADVRKRNGQGSGEILRSEKNFEPVRLRCRQNGFIDQSDLCQHGPGGFIQRKFISGC